MIIPNLRKPERTVGSYLNEVCKIDSLVGRKYFLHSFVKDDLFPRLNISLPNQENPYMNPFLYSLSSRSNNVFNSEIEFDLGASPYFRLRVIGDTRLGEFQVRRLGEKCLELAKKKGIGVESPSMFQGVGICGLELLIDQPDEISVLGLSELGTSFLDDIVLVH